MNATLDANKQHNCLAILHPIQELAPIKTVLPRDRRIVVNRRPLPQKSREQKVFSVYTRDILVHLLDPEILGTWSKAR